MLFIRGQLLFLVSALAFAGQSGLPRASELYEKTQYGEALKIVETSAASDAASAQLAGKCHFMLGQYRQASDQFERATQLEPSRSEHYHWLGRSLGRRAESGNPFTAPGLASRARQNFEKAAALDPKNIEALNDLFDYYRQAPGFLGGGFDKAQALLPKIRAIDEAEYHFALAQLAESQKEFNTAEQQLRRAAEIAPRSVGRLFDVAKFLAKRGRIQESESFIARAEKISPNDPKVLYEKAETYILAKKNLEEARALLQRYLNSQLTPDLPSVAEARKLLQRANGA